jgi:hypothetical protein
VSPCANAVRLQGFVARSLEAAGRLPGPQAAALLRRSAARVVGQARILGARAVEPAHIAGLSAFELMDAIEQLEAAAQRCLALTVA